VRLQDVPREHFQMVKFYTDYWRANRALLLDGTLEAPHPGANYPLVAAHDGKKQIVAVYSDVFVSLGDSRPTEKIDIVNGKGSQTVVLSVDRPLGRYRYTIRDCQGNIVKSGTRALPVGTTRFSVPVSGILALERTP
jgi:alpha-galactosidase